MQINIPNIPELPGKPSPKVVKRRPKLDHHKELLRMLSNPPEEADEVFLAEAAPAWPWWWDTYRSWLAKQLRTIRSNPNFPLEMRKRQAWKFLEQERKTLIYKKTRKAKILQHKQDAYQKRIEKRLLWNN